ncbi:hypothetical protein GUITHDRAFT_142031 [Guillardia theta CCMP2712]|uniref:CBM20 domain-containing protein n=1 Tax=Guillardia theta (strain CCMP2712) TaxID=905079 RepID=L1IYI6_GUITC|nr:hypothetical protein GUITHDRAFT_142031 [Guillardia theta CCMP2712]EKX41323.1 hypothetical protein GUITHDRAFT_142031 [Guillardia theta CCMP2712]|eukprot:XP_005828303.1 hypothetical protein GUITHDRAFT_142031 [Guillardia theta CCMP2712]
MHNRRRFSSSPVTFRVQCETKFGWEVCVTGGCEALGYWDPHHALLLRTDPARYPIWEGVGQLPGGCDIEYKYFVRPREKSELACWESCPNRVVRTGVTEKAILLVTDPDKITPEELERQEMLTSQYFRDWTTLSAPFSSTLIFNTARPQEDFKELLEDEAFQRPCALVFCRDSGTEIFVRDYDTPQIEGLNGNEPLLSTRPEDGAENGEDDEIRLAPCHGVTVTGAKLNFRTLKTSRRPLQPGVANLNWPGLDKLGPDTGMRLVAPHLYNRPSRCGVATAAAGPVRCRLGGQTARTAFRIRAAGTVQFVTVKLSP